MVGRLVYKNLPLTASKNCLFVQGELLLDYKSYPLFEGFQNLDGQAELGWLVGCEIKMCFSYFISLSLCRQNVVALHR